MVGSLFCVVKGEKYENIDHHISNPKKIEAKAG